MKKAQGQIITTILIILLILASIVIVWQVVGRTVQKGADEVSSQSDCLGVTLEIESAVAGEAMSIRRGTGGPSEDVQVYAIVGNKIKQDGGDVGELEVDSSISLDVGDANKEVKAGVILSDGTLCSPIASKKVAL